MKLKKFLATIIAVLSAASIAVGFSGCKDDEISLPPMTAEAPYYEYDSISDLTLCKRFSKYDKRFEEGISEEEYENYDAYNEFIDYYNGEFKNSCLDKFYLLNPGYPQEGWGPYMNTRDFEIYTEEIKEDEAYVNTLVSESIMLYDRKIGSPYDSNHYHGEPVLDGASHWTIYMRIFLFPIANELDGEIRLEFGEYNSEKWRFDHYINLYIGETCLGTCYYDAAVEIPLSWYQNYFKTNLFYGS